MKIPVKQIQGVFFIGLKILHITIFLEPLSNFRKFNLTNFVLNLYRQKIKINLTTYSSFLNLIRSNFRYTFLILYVSPDLMASLLQYGMGSIRQREEQ